MLLAVVLLSRSIAPAADREGLLTVVSPGAQVFVEPGSQEARIVLEVRFGSTSDGIPADRSTFLAKMTGVPASVLTPQFADVLDGTGAVVGRRAEVVVSLLTTRRRFSFAARVRGQGGRPTDSDRTRFVVRSNSPPMVRQLRIVGAIGTGPDGAPRVNPGMPVTLEAQLDDPDGDAVAQYEVRFGDGAVAARGAPGSLLRETHVFPAGPPDYVVTVTAWDWAASTTQTLRVQLNAAPVARLRLSPPIGTFRYPVFADGLASDDPDGDALTYAWNFGNGTSLPPSTNPIAQVVYPSAGSTQTYTVRLTVSDPSGLTSTASADLPVTGQYGAETMLSFVSPSANETVVIDDGLPVTIALDRATSGAAVDPSRLLVRLNGSDATGFFSVVQDPARGIPVAFTGTIPRARLRLTDTNTLAVEGTSVPFTRPGGGTDRVHDADKIGGIRVTTDARPVAALEVRPGEVFTGDPVVLDASGSSDAEGPLRFTFDFGDGTPPLADTASPTTSHAYAVEGLYRPTVTVSDGRWAVTAETQLVVRARPSGGTPLLEVDRATLDFGQVNATPFWFYLLDSEPERVVRVRNAGTGLLRFSQIAVDGAPFRVSSAASLPDLAPGESEFVAVGVDSPDGVEALPVGTWSGTLRLRTNGGDADVALAAETRLAVAPQYALIVPSTQGVASVIDFGPVLAPTTIAWRWVANQGTLPVVVDTVSITGDDAGVFRVAPLPGEVTAAPRQSDRLGSKPTPTSSEVRITFDPSAVLETRRLSAVLHVGWRYQAAPGVWTRGADLEVGLVGLASYVGLVSIEPSSGGVEMERVTAGQTTTMARSAAATLAPAVVTAQFVAGRKPVDVILSLEPLYPPGHTALALQRTTATLDPTSTVAQFPLVFRPQAAGHYSALVTATSSNPAQAPRRVLVHGYAKGNATIGVLGTPDTLWFVDEASFSRSQTGEADSALVIGLEPDGTLSRRDDGLGDLGVLVDPFVAQRSEVSVDQFDQEHSDLVIAGRQLYAIDADVLPAHDALETGLTAHALTRLLGGGTTGTGAIVRNRGFLGGLRAGGDPDLDAAGSAEPLDMDVTANQVVFFTDAPAGVVGGTTRLRWIDPLNAAQGLLAADLSLALTGTGGAEVSDLRAVWQGGSRHRLWLLLDDGALYGVDVDLASPSPLGVAQALAPSAIPTEAMVLDGAGRWYTVAGDGMGGIDVYREALDGGAATRQRIGQVTLPWQDAPVGLVVDAAGNVLVETTAGVFRFTPQPSGQLAPAGYVLAGGVYYADQLRGDVADGDDLRTAEVPVSAEGLWVGR